MGVDKSYPTGVFILPNKGGYFVSNVLNTDTDAAIVLKSGKYDLINPEWFDVIFGSCYWWDDLEVARSAVPKGVEIFVLPEYAGKIDTGTNYSLFITMQQRVKKDLVNYLEETINNRPCSISSDIRDVFEHFLGQLNLYDKPTKQPNAAPPSEVTEI